MNSRILVIAGDPSARDQIGTYLGLSGYRVFAAMDVAEALEVATAGWPDVILVDVENPDADGWTLIRRLRSHPETARVPILALGTRLYEEHCREVFEPMPCEVEQAG